jgi:hypothetical protein
MASSLVARFMGLMGRSSLPEGDGLYLPDSSIHMMFMRFPIDALFVGRLRADGSRPAVGMREHLPPWRGLVLPVRGAAAVIELPAGTLGRFAVRLGDTFVVESAEARTQGLPSA